MNEEIKKFFATVGLKMNREKSANNCTGCESDAVILKGHQGYKYLRKTEDSISIVKRDYFEKVRKEILCRVEKLCMTKLNGKNMIRAINEHAISVINYHVGLVKLEPSDFKSLDHDIRQVLIKYQVHLQPACKERLYLPRTEMGRGLTNIEFKIECMLLTMHKSFNETGNSSLRRAAILKSEEACASYLSLLVSYLKIRYGLEEITFLKALV
ncbi:hypothetical protein NAPIS_ORF01914 [Vairimorpha apis BRL 01]|uniref:Reverse transcriptase n=1 Tax=Vairimorpha apis BRL 01 TaxID=1037528 RepID=T0MHT4_9MICR|nr:hypothetical protein NAPIS_ORF01914 [Vairimorpha apis BRL 01]